MGVNSDFHPEAGREYPDTIAWYLVHSKPLARAFQQEVHEAVERIRDDPNRWATFEDPVRWIRLNRFPYLLYFEMIGADRVQVLAVAHANRRPGYWRGRRES